MTDLKPTPVHALMDTMKQMPPIPDQTAIVYHPTDEAKALVRECDVLIAVDVTDPKRLDILKGKELLERVHATGVSEAMRVLAVEVDLDTDELEWLAAVVEVTRGGP